MLSILLADQKKIFAGPEPWDRPLPPYNGTVETSNEKYWHIGERNPVEYQEIRQVVEVQADGDELEYILKHFKGIPTVDNCSVVRWFGDDAKFIANHLKK